MSEEATDRNRKIKSGIMQQLQRMGVTWLSDMREDWGKKWTRTCEGGEADKTEGWGEWRDSLPVTRAWRRVMCEWPREAGWHWLERNLQGRVIVFDNNETRTYA